MINYWRINIFLIGCCETGNITIVPRAIKFRESLKVFDTNPNYSFCGYKKYDITLYVRGKVIIQKKKMKETKIGDRGSKYFGSLRLFTFFTPDYVRPK